MSLSLKLELLPNNQVLVTNSISQQKKEVTLNFIKQINRNSLDILIQYKYYEVCIDAERVWNQVQYFKPCIEAAKEIEVEQEFRDIMVGDRWIKITDREREMYNKALPWINMYDPERGIAKTIEVVRKLEKFGWRIIEQNSNDIVMINYGKQTILFIPNSSDIKKETLQTIINKAELNLTEFFSAV